MTRGELAQIEVRFGTESGWLAMQQLPARERIEMFRADVMALLHAVQRLRDSERLRLRREILEELLDAGVSVATILSLCAETFDVPVAALLGPRRSLAIVRARHVAMYLCRRAGFSSPEIGREFGRDHASVLNGARRVQERMDGDVAFAARVQKLLKDLAPESLQSGKRGGGAC